MKVGTIYILSFIFFGFFFGGDDQQAHKEHLVTINHPAFGEDHPREFYLSEVRRDQSKLEGYFLDAESVICVDHRCRIVPVRLFWDELGNYQKYELSEGTILEKKEGKPFLPEDYDRLHEILKDKSSPYRNLSYYAITHEKVLGEGEVDAVTGATAIVLDKTKTVEGGAWSCYTLWHWANGEIIQEIHRITGAATSNRKLLIYLESEHHERKTFALHELTRRKEHNWEIVEAVVNQASKEISDPLFFKNTLVYLQKAESVPFYKSMKKLLEASSVDRRMVLWNTILKYDSSPVMGYFDNVYERLLESRNYQEFDLFLTVLERKKSTTTNLIEKMMPLLEENYSVLNRRIYWFLSDLKLSDSQDQILKTYYEENADDL